MDKNIFLKNLNCFIPFAYLVAPTISAVIFALVITMLKLAYTDIEQSLPNSTKFIHYLCVFIVLAVLVFFWRKLGLFITVAKEGKETKFLFGHTLLAISNIGGAVFAVAPLVMMYILGMKDAGFIWYGMFFVLPVAIILWCIGLIMVYTTRA